MGIKHIIMPDLGESVTEATVVEWFVQVGDSVKKYDPILEAQSDKVITEIPSEFDGKVTELLVEAGETVAIGTELLKIEVASEVDLKPAGIPDTPKEAVQEAFEPASESELETETQTEGVSEPKASSKTSSKTSSGKMKARYSPAVMRIAQEKDVDLTQVLGTGRHGRITRKDVENFEPEKSRKEGTIEKNESRETSHIVKADGVRRAIAQNVSKSAQEIPHAWLMVETDVTNIVKLREETKETFQKTEGLSLSFFPFFVKAVAHALKKHPLFNASWNDGEIIYHKDINLSIAVATDDHLFVPVIKQADQYSITGLTKKIKRLATAVRSGQLSADDMKEGTFTVNNTGSFGSVQSMGIINHPQVAILQVETIRKQVVPTEQGFKIADMVNMCLSIDHRLLDGLQAGRFLADVQANLRLIENEAQLY